MSGRVRAKARRGVSPMIATILLTAIVVVLAGVLFVLVSTLTHNVQPSPPLGNSFLLRPPSEAIVGTGHWYNFSIELATSGLVYHDLAFQIVDPRGAIVTPPGGTLVSVTNFQGNPIASYNWVGAAWSSGGTLLASDQHRICLYSATLVLSGDHLVTFGVASFSSSISTVIP